MKTDTSKRILAYIKEKGQVTAKNLAEHFQISPQAVHKQLLKLQESEQIYKIGSPPKVYYFINTKKNEIFKVEDLISASHINNVNLANDIVKQIENDYLIITPSGKRLDGWKGFVYWCEKQNLPIEKTAEQYIKTLQKYETYKKDGFISGLQKIKATFSEVFLDNIFYLDFYSIERFGKTKLGQLLLYAKQSQNKKIIREIVKNIKPTIVTLINKYNIKAVGFVSPTVKREIQFITELKKELNLSVHEIGIIKVKTEIAVPQKTLNKLEDRIENAQKTFVIEDEKYFDNLLLIDDAVGSGATLNEIAKKIKKQNIAKKIIGLAITGSFSGFDVISEV